MGTGSTPRGVGPYGMMIMAELARHRDRAMEAPRRLLEAAQVTIGVGQTGQHERLTEPVVAGPGGHQGELMGDYPIRPPLADREVAPERERQLPPHLVMRGLHGPAGG